MIISKVLYGSCSQQVMVSLNLCLVVGLSVDYVVHLAEGYHLSVRKDRLGRTQDMLERLGISVLSGAATTLGAAFFMMFAKIQFFLQVMYDERCITYYLLPRIENSAGSIGLVSVPRR